MLSRIHEIFLLMKINDRNPCRERSRVTGDELLLKIVADPEEPARLRADRTLIPSAVEEGLRFEPPVQPQCRQ